MLTQLKSCYKVGQRRVIPNERERAARDVLSQTGVTAAVDVDPAFGSDLASGSNIEKVITKTAVLFCF